MDWRGGGGRAFDRHGIVGTGAGHLLTNNACWAGHLIISFQIPGVCPGVLPMAQGDARDWN